MIFIKHFANLPQSDLRHFNTLLLPQLVVGLANFVMPLPPDLGLVSRLATKTKRIGFPPECNIELKARRTLIKMAKVDF